MGKKIAVKTKAITTDDFLFIISQGRLQKIRDEHFYIERVFKKYHSVGPTKFSQMRQIAYAKKLLKETNYTLQTIA